MILKKNIIILFFLFLSITLSVLYLGIHNISLNNTNWLTNYDNISDFLALKFFINDTWRFPLGLNPNYGGITNSIVYSGAVPILSFISKIFKNILPFNFHFFSIWIVLCFFLQLFFSFKIIYFYTNNVKYSLIGSIFFLISPTFIERIFYHLSLSAHWLILSILYFEIINNKKYINYQRTILICLSSLIHFYFSIILYLISIIFIFDKFFKDKNYYSFLRINLIISISLLTVMYVSGYFVIPAIDSIAFGYGIYKANLLTLIDPKSVGMNYSWSIILGDIYNSGGELEGFSYLGLGIIFILIFLLYSLNKIKFFFKSNYKYLIIFAIFLVLAVSFTINMGRYEIINLTLPNILYAPFSIIRASGRLIWPSYYIIILASICLLYKVNKNASLLFLFLLFQLFDFSDALKNKFFNKNLINTKLNLNYDKNLIANFKINEMSLKTTYIENDSKIFVQASNILINENFLSTNLFRLGRYNREELSNLRVRQYLDFNNNTVDNKSIFLIDNIDHLRELKFLFKNSEHGFFFRNNLIFFIPNSKFLMNQKDHNGINNINFNSLKKNNIKYIKFKDPNGFLGMGWSHNLEGRGSLTSGSWSEGYNSSIFFNNYNSEDIKLIKLDISSSIANKNDMLKVDFYLNNKKIKSIKIKNKFSQSIYLETKNYLKFGPNYLKIIILNPISPVSKLENVDGRLLGFKLDSIELK